MFHMISMAPNGLGICGGAAIEIRHPSFEIKLNRIIEAEYLMSSRTFANTMLWPVRLCPLSSTVLYLFLSFYFTFVCRNNVFLYFVNLLGCTST